VIDYWREGDDLFGYWKRKSEEESGISNRSLRPDQTAGRKRAPANIWIDLLRHGKVSGRKRDGEKIASGAGCYYCIYIVLYCIYTNKYIL